MKKDQLDANLIKKYHQDIVYNYAEYPTKDHWSFKFLSDQYKNALLDNSTLPSEFILFLMYTSLL